MKGVSVLSKARLTEAFDAYNQCNDKNCKLSYCDRDCEHYQRMVDKLAEYENLEEQCLLLRLPCERVWFICDKGSKYATVMSKSIYDLEIYQIEEIDVKEHYFSSKEKAEEKLRELEGK